MTTITEKMQVGRVCAPLSTILNTFQYTLCYKGVVSCVFLLFFPTVDDYREASTEETEKRVLKQRKSNDN